MSTGVGTDGRAPSAAKDDAARRSWRTSSSVVWVKSE
jgi:hypothetical protein